MNTSSTLTRNAQPAFITNADRDNIAAGNIKTLFPTLAQNANDNPFVYLDSAAATLKPTPVIRAINYYYNHLGVNTHRGVYSLSEQATALFNESRSKIKHLINAQHNEEIVFTYGTTDGFNLLAETYGRYLLHEGDEILISEMEHHANILPWQKIAEDKNLVLKVVRINEAGEIDLDHYNDLLTPEVKIVSLVHISNVLGTINPIKTLIQRAHQNGSVVALDCAQTLVHGNLNVLDLNVDFVSFSSNKMFGPTGAGVFYGKKQFLDKMPPYRRGGGSILNVSFDKTIFQGAPQKFEAGTQPIASVIGLGVAADLIRLLQPQAMLAHDRNLVTYMHEQLKQLPYVKLIGNAAERVGVFSFVIPPLHPHDLGTLLNDEGVAIRVGHHCAQPLVNKMGFSATARASFAFYNTPADIDAFIAAIVKAYKLLSH